MEPIFNLMARHSSSSDAEFSLCLEVRCFKDILKFPPGFRWSSRFRIAESPGRIERLFPGAGGNIVQAGDFNLFLIPYHLPSAPPEVPENTQTPKRSCLKSFSVLKRPNTNNHIGRNTNRSRQKEVSCQKKVINTKTTVDIEKSFNAEKTFEMENTMEARVSFTEDIAQRPGNLHQHPNGCMCQTCKAAMQERNDRHTLTFTATKGWLAKNTKPCPRLGCGTPIQKVKGGKGVRCGQCGHEFCWTCLEPWSGPTRNKHDKLCGVKRAKAGLRRLVSDVLSGYALPPHLWGDFNGMFLDM
ncbi:hypothetical protein F5Y12DRAFT_721161 [Xylaria sp. FL1777]|nr:hypothetical protein F5Y12DRAFT_721161 [Xylaria sp. FL1777]